MKKRLHIPVATLAVMLATAAGHAAGPDMAAWTHVVPIELADRPAKGLVELALTPEVFGLTRPDLADLRVMTTGGVTVPYVTRVDRGTIGRRESYAPARKFNALFTPGKQSSVEVDFGSRAVRTRIDVATPGTNFRRRVSIEASQDGTAWQVLKRSDWLFRVSYEGGSYEKSQILLPDNDFRYLRITVFPAPDDPEQVEIQQVTAWRQTGTPPQLADVPTKSVVVKEDGKARVTEIEADLGYENLPVQEVALEIGDAMFLRRVEVLGRNVKSRTVVEPVENSQPRTREVEEPWSTLSAGSIYRLPGGEGGETSTGLMLPMEEQCRYVLVRIHNGDDVPLKFGALKVRRLQEYVDFRAELAGPYQLYVGNGAAERPNYDLPSYAEKLRAEGITVAKLGPAGANPLFAAPVKTIPWSERHALILWTTLGVVLAVLTGLVLRQARHALSLGPDASGKQA